MFCSRCNPNNPDGSWFTEGRVALLVEKRNPALGEMVFAIPCFSIAKGVDDRCAPSFFFSLRWMLFPARGIRFS
jgi:hypothetical protein